MITTNTLSEKELTKYQFFRYLIKDISMSLFLVTWNLNNEKSGYIAARTAILVKLGSFKHMYEGRGLDTIALVLLPSNMNCSDLFDHIFPVIDADDRLFVTLVTKDYKMYASENMRNFIKQYA